MQLVNKRPQHRRGAATLLGAASVPRTGCGLLLTRSPSAVPPTPTYVWQWQGASSRASTFSLLPGPCQLWPRTCSWHLLLGLLVGTQHAADLAVAATNDAASSEPLQNIGVLLTLISTSLRLVGWHIGARMVIILQTEQQSIPLPLLLLGIRGCCRCQVHLPGVLHALRS